MLSAARRKGGCQTVDQPALVHRTLIPMGGILVNARFNLCLTIDLPYNHSEMESDALPKLRILACLLILGRSGILCAHPVDAPSAPGGAGIYSPSVSKVFRRVQAPPSWTYGKLGTKSPLNERIYVRDDMTSYVWDLGETISRDRDMDKHDPCEDLHRPEHKWHLPTRDQLQTALNHRLSAFILVEGAELPCAFFAANGRAMAGKIGDGSLKEVPTLREQSCRLLCVGM